MGRRKIQPLKAFEQEEDLKLVEFINLNAPYLSKLEIRFALEISAEKLESLIHHYNIDMREKEKEPRAADIAQEIGFLPVGTKVDQWARGTLVRLSSSINGIHGVTKHFAMGDE